MKWLLIIIMSFSILHAVEWNWSHSYGGNSADHAYDVVTAEDGNIYAVGNFNSDVSFGDITLTSVGDRNFYLAKFDSDGNPVWAVAPVNYYNAEVTSMALDNSGNIVIIGRFEEHLAIEGTIYHTIGSWDTYIAKFSSEGSLIWFENFGREESAYNPNFTVTNYGNDIATDADDNIYFCGRSFGGITIGDYDLTPQYYGDGFFAKLDADGNVLWADKTHSSYDARAYGIDVDADGNVYVAGDFKIHLILPDIVYTSTNDWEEAFVLKYDSEGNYIWSMAIQGDHQVFLWELDLDDEGNVLITGNFYCDILIGSYELHNPDELVSIFIAKISPEGTVLWATSADSPLAGLVEPFIQKLSFAIDGDYIYLAGSFLDFITIQGETSQSAGFDILDVFLIKLYENGNLLDLFTITGQGSAYGQAVDVKDGSITLAGMFHNSILMPDPYYSQDHADIFITNFCLAPHLYPPRHLFAKSQPPHIALSWSEPAGGGHSGYLVYRNDELIAETEELSYLDEDMGTGSYSYYVTSYIDDNESEPSNIVTIDHTDASIDFVIETTELIGNHPNPFNPETNISFSLKNSSPVRLDIYSVNGRKVRTLLDNKYDAGLHNIIWDGKDDRGNRQASGIYLYKLKTDDYSATRKMIMLK